MSAHWQQYYDKRFVPYFDTLEQQFAAMIELLQPLVGTADTSDADTSDALDATPLPPSPKFPRL